VTRLAGSVRLERGQAARAWTDLTESLAAYRRPGSRRGEALALRSIGLYHRATGDLEASIAACDAAAQVFRELGDELMQSYAVRAATKARFRLGRIDGVRERLDWCLSVCRAMGDRWGQAITCRTLGEFSLATGSLTEAEQALREALELWDGMDAPLWRARTLQTLAELHTRRDEHDTATRLRAEAARVFRAHGAQEHDETAL
jgi:tetratricopeptide (TPR) repeat protein